MKNKPNKSEVFIDLSKLSKKQIKSLPQIFENAGHKILSETLSDLISGKITDGFKFLFYSPSGWNQNDYPLNGRTELTYPEFIKLFEGGEGENEIENIKDIAHTEGVLIGLKICKEMWAQGTISHENIQEEIYHYQEELDNINSK